MQDTANLLSPYPAPPALPAACLYGSAEDAARWLRAGLDAAREINRGLSCLIAYRAAPEADTSVSVASPRTNRGPLRAGHPIAWTALTLHTILADEPYPRQPPMGRIPTGIIGELC